MPKYVAFIRMNDESGALLQPSLDAIREVGLADARSFKSTRNVIFSAPSRSLVKLRLLLEDVLASASGYIPIVVLRTTAEIRGVAARVATLQRTAKDDWQVAVAFLPQIQDLTQLGYIASLESEYDELDVYGREVYWRFLKGRDSNASFPKRLQRGLKVPVIARTGGLLTELSAECEA